MPDDDDSLLLKCSVFRSDVTNQQRWQEMPDLFDFKVYLDADLEDRSRLFAYSFRVRGSYAFRD